MSSSSSSKCMPVVPSPSVSRGAVVLQPSYFTSSLFTDPLRQDISELCNEFCTQYTTELPLQPFTMFKRIWETQDWKWLHFYVFDRRARHIMMESTLRMFLERTLETETPLNRVAALYGFFTFFNTQPIVQAPLLHRISFISIPVDIYKSLLNVPNYLEDPSLLSLKPTVINILSTLIKDQIFYLVPASSLSPLNPRELPREKYILEEVPAPVKKRVGRPSKRDIARNVNEALAFLENSLGLPPDIIDAPAISAEAQIATMGNTLAPSRSDYQAKKTELLELVDTDTPAGRDALKRVNDTIVRGVKAIDQSAAARNLKVPAAVNGQKTAVQRLEDANEGFLHGKDAGVLSLLEGAGLDKVSGKGKDIDTSAMEE